MMLQRTALYLLLLVVAAAAAVLSFDALRGLALLCGFTPDLAWLLPVTIDAGAAAASIVWLGTAAPGARSYGRALALVLLASSVGGNALGHGLAAFEVRPHWLVVVAVSAIAPAVLGALVHLVVLAVRPGDDAAAQDRPLPPAGRPTGSLDDEFADLLAAMKVEEYVPGEDQAEADEPAPAQAGEPLDEKEVTRLVYLEERKLPDRSQAVDTDRDGEVIADLRALFKQPGRRPSRDETKAIYRIGSEKAKRVLLYLGWLPRVVGADERAEDRAGPGGEQARAAAR